MTTHRTHLEQARIGRDEKTCRKCGVSIGPAEPPRTVTGDGAGKLPEPVVWSEAPVSGWQWWLKRGERIVAKVTSFGGNRPPFHAEFPLTCQLGEFATLDGAQAAVAQALNGQGAEPAAAALTDEQIYSLSDQNGGHRFRAADEEGVQFDKHALLEFSRALLAASQP